MLIAQHQRDLPLAIEKSWAGKNFECLLIFPAQRRQQIIAKAS